MEGEGGGTISTGGLILREGETRGEEPKSWGPEDREKEQALSLILLGRPRLSRLPESFVKVI